MRSKVINNTLNPEWNEVFLLYVRDISRDLIKVSIMACWPTLACAANSNGMEHCVCTRGMPHHIHSGCIVWLNLGSCVRLHAYTVTLLLSAFERTYTLSLLLSV